ncbi:MAG TPA: response regulator [Flavisolibacter sp.]|jgi:CheY-like chemotaxis protein|nr:response regulator [Flavisolibacter sp.]
MNKLIEILLVEDDQLDATDIKRSLDKLDLIYRMHIAKNGEEAIDYLGNITGPLPDIVLIDINMPRMNGLELLQIIRTTEAWKHLKCFMITTSDEKVDKTTARELGVSGYIVKPFKANNVSSMDAFNLMIDLLNMKAV